MIPAEVAVDPERLALVKIYQKHEPQFTFKQDQPVPF
jgi:hypothetical protein